MLLLVGGARPNWMKLAPIWRELQRRAIPSQILHTGQHSGEQMSDVFFRELGLPSPDHRCDGGFYHTQTFVDETVKSEKPDAVIVVGDVDSTLAAALSAARLSVLVVHVEAGLRSRDWSMPEEMNRVLVDQMSDLCLVPSDDAVDNLRAEGIAPMRIRFVGNTMIDSLLEFAKTDLSPNAGDFALATVHRPVNVDSADDLRSTFAALKVVAARMPVVMPIHPRTAAALKKHGLEPLLDGMTVVPPLGYRDFVSYMRHAKLVVTDSGGVQEETTALGVPCLTLRESTERPVTVIFGTNTIVGRDGEKIRDAVDAVVAGRYKTGYPVVGWDGKAAHRVVGAVVDLIEGRIPPRRRRLL